MESFDLSRNTASCDIKFIQYKNYKKEQSHSFPFHVNTFHMAMWVRLLFRAQDWVMRGWLLVPWLKGRSQ